MKHSAYHKHERQKEIHGIIEMIWLAQINETRQSRTLDFPGIVVSGEV